MAPATPSGGSAGSLPELLTWYRHSGRHDASSMHQVFLAQRKPRGLTIVTAVPDQWASSYQ
jgi:hypothetical protein